MIEGWGGIPRGVVSPGAESRARGSRWARNIFRPSILSKLLREAFARWGGADGGREERAAPQTRRQSFTLEAIEPRLLLSADLSYAAGSSAHDFTVKAEQSAGNYYVNLYETSNLLSSIATKTIVGGSDVSISIGRDDTLG